MYQLPVVQSRDFKLLAFLGPPRAKTDKLIWEKSAELYILNFIFRRVSLPLKQIRQRSFIRETASQLNGNKIISRCIFARLIYVASVAFFPYTGY
jgi:hypothetical protein